MKLQDESAKYNTSFDKPSVQHCVSKLPIIIDVSNLLAFVNLRYKSWTEGIIQLLPSYSYNIDASKLTVIFTKRGTKIIVSKEHMKTISRNV